MDRNQFLVSNGSCRNDIPINPAADHFADTIVQSEMKSHTDMCSYYDVIVFTAELNKHSS